MTASYNLELLYLHLQPNYNQFNYSTMAKITKEAALLYHSQGKPGKIEVVPTKPYSTQTDLSLAYSPGVAEPCLEIEKNPQDAYKYTAKGNLVAVISNGTAVLGLGDIGALSGKPVMEGKGLLFKIYAGIDVFDIEVNEKDPDKFIEAVKAIAPTFGGINLEDIKAPECFEIERRLKEELDIPVMHDDQHGTAIISSAGLLNALEVAGKKIEEVKIVVNGAGASATSCTKLYEALGARRENILMLDSKGVITSDRENLTEQKRYFATDRRDVHTLAEAIKGADVFLGLSKGNVLTQDMVRSMADHPIVFALANPTPEISYEDAMAARPDVLMSTGRSDYPNQINNVIGFPYIFRGALDTQAKAINEAMKIAAVHAIANLAKQPVPDVVNEAYHVNNFTFGPEYFIPKPVDPRLITEVSCAVAKAAMESGVARKDIEDWDAYRLQLRELMGYESKLTRQLYDTARRNPQRVVFAEGIHPNMLKAAVEAKAEGICHPIILGNDEAIEKLAKELDLSLEGIEIVNLRHPDEAPRRERYARILSEKRAREGVTYEEANDKMFERNYFGMMMVETGEADAFITGLYTKYSNTIKVAKEVIGIPIPLFINKAMPEWFGAVFMLCILSASMSTLSAQFHTMGAAFGADAFPKLGRSKNPNSTLGVRIGVLCSILVSYVICYTLSASIIARGTALFMGICAATFLPTYFCSLYWKGATRQGALASLWVGGLASLFAMLFLHKAEAAPVGLCKALFGQDVLIDVYPWHAIDPILFALPLSAITIVLVSLATQKKAF